MPNTSSAKKALRSSKRKEANNKNRKYAVRQALKELRRVLATSPKNYQTALSKVFSSLDKAVKRNVIPKGRANRKKSRVAKMVDTVNQTAKTDSNKSVKETTKKAKNISKVSPAKKSAVKTDSKKKAAKKDKEEK